MNPTPSVYDDPKLQAARDSYTSAARAANDAQSSSLTLPDMLNKALTEKFSTNNPMVATRESALKNYLNESTQAPLDYTPKSAGGNSDVVYNPLQQANLIQSRRSAAIAPLTSANYLLSLAQGGIPAIIDAASRAAQAETTRLQGNAQLAHTTYQDILSELSGRAQEALQRQQLAENIRQFNEQMSLSRQKAAKGSGSGIGSSGLDWGSLYQEYLDSLNGGGNSTNGQVDLLTPAFGQGASILDYNRALTKAGR